jgi:hypothetical protein
MVSKRDRKSFGLGKTKTIQKLLRRLAPLTFLIRVQALRDPLRGELLHVKIFMDSSCEIPSCSVIDLAEIQPTVFQD